MWKKRNDVDDKSQRKTPSSFSLFLSLSLSFSLLISIRNQRRAALSNRLSSLMATGGDTIVRGLFKTERGEREVLFSCLIDCSPSTTTTKLSER